MPVWAVLAIYALAHARLTGLVVADQITAPARDAILRRVGVLYCDLESRYHLAPVCSHDGDKVALSPNRNKSHWLAKIATCAWCLGLWLALPLAPLAAWHAGISLAYAPALALAMSYATGATSDLGRR